MKVLVTGATGFVGKALVPALRAYGHEVTPMGRAEADLRRDVDWDHYLDGHAAVVHLAGLAHATRALPDAHYDQINHQASATLARAAKRTGARLVFLSSIKAQTGSTSSEPMTESGPCNPVDAYGRSKLSAEQAIRDSGASYAIFRPVLIYGSELKANLATLQKLANLPVPLPFGSFHNRRSLLSRDRLIGAVNHVLALRSNDTYIVADRNPITLRELISAFRIARGRRPLLVPVPFALMHGLLRIGGADLWDRVGGELVASSAKLAATGWEPEPDTAAALRAIVSSASSRV